MFCSESDVEAVMSDEWDMDILQRCFVTTSVNGKDIFDGLGLQFIHKTWIGRVLLLHFIVMSVFLGIYLG